MISHSAGWIARVTSSERSYSGAMSAAFSIGDVAEARRIMVQYADLRVSLADASNVVLANRNDTLDVLTLDERHFRTLRGPGGRPFRVLPADAG